MTLTGTRPTLAAQRFTARARAARRRPWRRALVTALVLALLAGAAWMAWLAPVFAVAQVSISGGSGALQEQVRAVADRSVGTPLLRVDPKAVEAAIESNLRVADATVQRRFPRSLVVAIVPRVPVLAITHPKGVLELVDIEGVAFQKVRVVPAGIAVVRSEGSGDVSTEGVAAALQVVTALPVPLRSRVADLRLTKADSVTFRLGATTVVWGGSDRPQLKADLIGILLGGKPATIDVSAPDTPVTT